ncbi:MAG: hypothetical protein ACI8Y7_001140 [Candidatus Woesearchaeota archaeon]|jgi:hypothetical protein
MIIDATAELTDETRLEIPLKYFVNRRASGYYFWNEPDDDDTFEFHNYDMILNFQTRGVQNVLL